ncbi:ATPase, T2SS/T4P/T4SS family [Paenibacillus agilis]|uniref:Flp pilus assembly protein CpaF n=1 Tax=Paenibacillus agilis TaxID=3020863 RepID=A0A559ID72_9BACL|nr:ATPase, T2SS/T4P/T4SS family [Paenibacillus agilis]TVX85619.1 Flp pilus assembly protein CpaF [Paenibacillus agilis]
MINLIIICLIILGLIAFLIYRLRDPHGNVKKKAVHIDYEQFTVKAITDFIKKSINDVTSSDLYDEALDQEDYERRQNKKAELKNALKGSTSGNINDKLYVKDFIFDRLIKNYDFNEQTIDLVIPFSDPDKLTVQDKFEILMNEWKKEHGYKALGALIEKYKLDGIKSIIENGETQSYGITETEIAQIFKKEIKHSLSFEDKLHVITQRIYQQFKGLGVIDEIRDMEIDGVSGGVSGSFKVNEVEDEIKFLNGMSSSKMNINSVWILYKGKSIHLSFLGFHSMMELKRVCQNIYKHNNPGPLNESNGFIVNDMWDGSRIVVFRPPYSESWAFWNRKFNPSYTAPEAWFQAKDPVQQIRNEELPLTFLKFLMKGSRTVAITGEQGAGKTTLMMGLVKFIYGYWTLRVLEMAFELHLRIRYSGRNINSVRETINVSGQKAMDSLKKTDGQVNITGEVATPEQAAWAIQNAGVGFKFSMFSHHGKTPADMIYSLRNSVMQTGHFSNERIAEAQIVRSIPFNVHACNNSFGDAAGVRYLEHITEIIPVTEQPIPDNFEKAAIEYFKAMISPKLFETRVCIAVENGSYVAKSRPSETQIQEMKKNMEPQDRIAFEEFLDKYWAVSC